MQGAFLLSKWVVTGVKSPKSTKETLFSEVLVVGLLWGTLLAFHCGCHFSVGSK